MLTWFDLLQSPSSRYNRGAAAGSLVDTAALSRSNTIRRKRLSTVCPSSTCSNSGPSSQAKHSGQEVRQGSRVRARGQQRRPYMPGRSQAGSHGHSWTTSVYRDCSAALVSPHCSRPTALTIHACAICSCTMLCCACNGGMGFMSCLLQLSVITATGAGCSADVQWSMTPYSPNTAQSTAPQSAGSVHAAGQAQHR